MFFIRSWVIGRGVTTPCSDRAIAAASAAPIHIGRYRSPSRSRSRTMGWFVGSSTRTPSSCISIMTLAALYGGCASEGNLADGREVRDEQVGIRAQRGGIDDLEDVAEVPVALLEVEAVAHDERVRTVEADVPGTQRRDPADG